MGKIDKMLQTSLDDIVPVKYADMRYNIFNEIDNKFKITLSPINLLNKFIGRKDDIKNILNNLNDNHLVVVINGMGGIGKTSLCKYLFCSDIKEVAQKYKYIAWVDYNKNIVNSFVKSFSTLNIPYKSEDTIKDKFEKIILELNKLGNDLLIFIDNVDKTRRSDSELEILLKIKPHVIITSRIKLFDNNFIYSLGFLDLLQCNELFLEHYNLEYPNKSSEIEIFLPKVLSLCGYHSLTIELVAKCSNDYGKGGITLKHLYKKLQRCGFDLSSLHSKTTSNWDDQFYEKTVLEHICKVFSISGLSKTQKHSLFKLSFLSSSSISLDKAVEILDIDKQIILSLANRGWVSTDGNEIILHASVKQAVMSQNDKKVNEYKYILSNFNKYLDWEKNFYEISNLIFHAEELSYRFKNTQYKDLFLLQNKISSYYKYQGDMKTCIEYMKKQASVSRKRKCFKDVATCQKDIATIYIELGKFDIALGYIKKSLYFRKLNYPKISFELSECYAHIGFIYQEKGEYEKAITNYKKALHIRNKLYGSNHRITAWSYHNLANVFCYIYDYSKALKYIDKTIAIRKRILKNKEIREDLAQLDLAQSENMKGYILERCGNFQDAYTLLKSSLEIRKKRLGKNHLFTATSYGRFAYALIYLNFLKEAEKNIKNALDILASQSNRDSIDTAIIYNIYAIIHRKNNNFDSAIKLHENAIMIFCSELGMKHARLAEFYEDYGDTFAYFGRLNDSKRYYNKSKAIYETFLPYNNEKYKEIAYKVNNI